MKLDETQRSSIMEDKKHMTTKEIQQKYNVSRSTIQRIKLPNLEARAAEFHEDAKDQAPRNETKENFAEMLVNQIQREETPIIPQIDRQPIIQKILMNADTFPAHYPFITDKTAFAMSLNDKSSGQLQDLLNTMERTRSTNNLSAQMKQVFFVSARAAETLGSRIRLKTDGLTNALIQQQQELDYIFKELALTYSDKFTKASSPEMRLLMMFGMTILQVDSQNRIREAMARTETPEEKYQDL